MSRLASSAYITAGPVVVAHRGGAGCAPENTLGAFRRSSALGLDYFEIDVQQTADGVVVGFHDSGVQRVTGRRGRLRRMPWSQVRTLRIAGEHPVPRLVDVLEEFPDARFMVDLKDGAALGALAAVLRRTRAVPRVCLTGVSDGVMADARALLGPGLATAMGWDSMGRLMLAACTGTRPRGVLAAPFVHVPLRFGSVQVLTNPALTSRVVELAAGFGAEVMVWTVDHPIAARRLFEAGVRGVITDRPDLVNPHTGPAALAAARAAGREPGRPDAADQPWTSSVAGAA